MTTIDEEDKENYGIEKYDNNINGGCEEETKTIFNSGVSRMKDIEDLETQKDYHFIKVEPREASIMKESASINDNNRHLSITKANDRPRSILRNENKNGYFCEDKQKLNRASKSFVNLKNPSFACSNMHEFKIIKGPKNIEKSYYIQRENLVKQNELHICKTCKNKTLII